MQADFLALDFAGVARDVTGLTQRLAQFLVVFDQGAGDAVANGAGLTGGATALDGAVDIKLLLQTIPAVVLGRGAY